MSALGKHRIDAWRAHTRSAEAQSLAPDARIGFAGSFTIDPLLPYFGATLLECGNRRPELLNANYNQILRLCRDPASEFGSRLPDTIVVLWRIEDLGDPCDPMALKAARDLMLGSARELRDTFSGTIVFGLPPRPRPFVEGIVDFARPSQLECLWFDTLSKVADLAQSLTNFYTVDLEAMLTACGESAGLDHRKSLLYRQPYSESFHIALADVLARIYRARRMEAKKCLVLDCDNTLWGGVIGEDGVGGVELSDDMPGRGYREFQRQVAALSRSGVLVALNSKNNPDDVWDMFDNHAAMILRRSDISASRINWRPKSENLKAIAAELNIGLDSLVFVDDSPFEIEEVRTHAPEVMCFMVPEDVADLPVAMREIARSFDRLNITGDDRARVEMMHQEAVRQDLLQKMTEAEFLVSLKLEVFIKPASPAEIARIAQLINKTNQFNVTTRRYSVDEVGAFLKDEYCDIYSATVQDRFGDYGLVGVAIIKYRQDVAEFDSLLMSCRVLGRGVETVMISHALHLARSRGAREIRGVYIPTKKNAMVADLFSRHGFTETDAAPDDVSGEASATFWSRTTDALPMPDFLTVHSQP